MKRLVLILIVVLILFGAMMFYGLSRDDSSSRGSQPPDWMGLFDNFIHKQPVTARDILPASCFNANVFISRISVPCQIHIRTVDDSSTRTMKLELVSGPAKINLQTLGEAGMRMSLTLRSDKPNSPQFQIPKEGADLAIACESGSEALPCQLKMNP